MCKYDGRDVEGSAGEFDGNYVTEQDDESELVCKVCDEWNRNEGMVKMEKRHNHNLQCKGLACSEEGSAMDIRRVREHQVATKALGNQFECNQTSLNKGGPTDLDQRYHEFRVTSSNHDAETHDDRVGRSHADCLDHDEGKELDEKECWRPSYMFNWLRAAGWNVKDATIAFEQYQGKNSYEQLNLQTPTPMQNEDGDESEWYHMSDYDETG